MTERLAFITDLKHAIAHGSREQRSEMLLKITDLFIHGSAQFSEDEIALFDDVLTRLAMGIEASVRSLLAQRLSPIANGPLNITRMLARDDEIRVAYPILVQSERLDETTLVEAARSKSQDHLLAISCRKSLSELVTDVLVERGNRQVALSTAKNPGAKFSQVGFSRLVKRSAGDDALGACVGARPDLPRPLFLALLETASEVVRSKLLQETPTLASEINRAVAVVADGLRNNVNISSTNYEEAQALVQSLNESGQLNDNVVRTFAEVEKIEEAIASLASLCNVPIDVVEQAMVQDKAETMLILAKAANLLWPTTKLLLLLRARNRYISSNEIEHHLASFERLNIKTAQKIIEFYKLRGAG